MIPAPLKYLTVLLVVAIVPEAIAQATTVDTFFWSRRDTVLQHTPGAAKVRIAIWDSGVDTALFHDRLARDAQGAPILRGYDPVKERQDIPMALLPDSIATRSSQLDSALLAVDDLDAGVDSPQALALEAWFETQTPAQQDAYFAAVDRYSGYVHGTAVADIALNGLPDAEIVIARMEWWHGSPPVPCWSRALADKEAASIRDLLDFVVAQGVRVVVMSWARAEKGYLSNLAECAPEMPENERTELAHYTVQRIREALIAGMQAAPDVLFIGAAGNAGKSLETADQGTRYSAPNFILVGAADDTGAAVSWSNAGAEVTLLARGERVPARLPSGTWSYPSGTSMSVPVVANAAAKMLCVSPHLTAVQLRSILGSTATVNAEGSPVLHTRRAVEAASGQR